METSPVFPIDQAPRDGTEIMVVYKDGSREPACWNEDRCCMLGPRAGSYPPGWSPANGFTDRNLPLDDSEIVSFHYLDPEDDPRFLAAMNILKIAAPFEGFSIATMLNGLETTEELENLRKGVQFLLENGQICKAENQPFPEDGEVSIVYDIV